MLIHPPHQGRRPTGAVRPSTAARPPTSAQDHRTARLVGPNRFERAERLSPDRLVDRLEVALARREASLAGLAGAEPVDDRDAVLTLQRVHDLHLGPFGQVASGANRQHHPVIADIKWRLECAFLERLEGWDEARRWDLPDDPIEALRAVQATDRVPWVYHWLAERASPGGVRTFLELEGGPDGRFDDLVAQCQVGITGGAKVELAHNYWDEMGRGDGASVHTELHRVMADALGFRAVSRAEQPLACLERALLGSTLATNRWLQPEMVGALGLIELQAGPRCRKVVAALERIGAGEQALAFYEEHARVDPLHGRAWVDRVVTPLAAEHPDLAWRIVRGARWRSTITARFLAATHSVLGLVTDSSPGPDPAGAERRRPAPMAAGVHAPGERP